MIIKQKKEIIKIIKKNKVISFIIKTGKIVWQAVHSCFGGGYWDDNQPWDNDDAWK